MLTTPRAVMINRGGAGLDNGRAAAQAVGLPTMGEDPADLVLTDAGNAMIGFGFKQSEANLVDKQCCSRSFLDDVNVEVVNPATQIELVAPNFAHYTERAGDALKIDAVDLSAAVVTSRVGPRLSVYDDDGNLTTFISAVAPRKPTRVDHKFLDLLARRDIALGGNDAEAKSPVATGFTMTVSNMVRTNRFYREILGLTTLSAGQRTRRFDAGPIIITVQAEPHIGMVKSMRGRNLLRDQLIFYTPDIQAEVDNLQGLGVVFPLGIEESISAGAVAYFQDPDGHNLWLWQPPDPATPGLRINYFPTLDRILAEHP